jgi:hypothetical protein
MGAFLPWLNFAGLCVVIYCTYRFGREFHEVILNNNKKG